MDHLAPSSGVNWYSSYNAFGEFLAAAPQLPPFELGVLEVVGQQQCFPQGHVQYSTQGQGLHYGQDLSHPGVLDTREECTLLENTVTITQPEITSQVRVPILEKITCQECGATFACVANLRNHMRIHTGERPFVCEECGASFTQRSNMRTHKRVHTGERPYMCGICGQTFARSSHLPGHMRTHTGEKPFRCPQCGRSFATNQIMKNHLRTHTGERPFVCDVCDATFAQSSCLATHKKIHTGERKFKCGRCGKAFICRSGLQTHERVHTGEKPYSCDKCDKSFKTSSYLSKHRQKYCGNENFAKANKQPDSEKIKKSVDSHKPSKCKKSLKQPSQLPPKWTRSRRTRLAKRNEISPCKLELSLIPLEEDVGVAEDEEPRGENCPIGNCSENRDGLHVRLNSEMVPTAPGQEEGTMGEYKLESLDKLVLAEHVQDVQLKDVLLKQEDLQIKVEERTFIQETCTSIPQDRHKGKSELFDVSDIQRVNVCDETEPFEEPFNEIQMLSRRQSVASHSRPAAILQPPGSSTATRVCQLIENYFDELNSASLSEDAHKEKASSPSMMGVQVCEDLPQHGGVALPTDMPHQAYAMKDGSLWCSSVNYL